MGRFDGKVVLVTGSSSGIGAATARLFAAEGAAVVVNSATSVETGEQLAAELPGASYVRADVSDAGAAATLIDETIQRHRRLDVLVNNAGTTARIPHADLDAVTDEIFQRIMNVNLFGTWQLTRRAMPHLKATGDGAVVNVTSIAGIRPVGSSIPYAVSKAAVNHLTLLLANASGPEVRVNAVAPGFVESPWTADWPDAHEEAASRAALGRTGRPEEIAQVIVDVAAARFMTGHVVVLDGGLSLRI